MVLLLLSTLPMLASNPAKATGTGKEAEAMFHKIYDMVFGDEGSSLSYSVNIIGLYKTQGDIVYKAGKIHYMESRYAAWEDGKSAYMVDKKKKTVDIYRADDDKKDEYLAKFKYDVNNFIFSYTTEGDYYNVRAKVRDGKYFGIREVTAKVQRKNLYPVSLTIKLAFLRTTVHISKFHPGDINDAVFQFPQKQFASYTFTDHRNEK